MLDHLVRKSHGSCQQQDPEQRRRNRQHLLHFPLFTSLQPGLQRSDLHLLVRIMAIREYFLIFASTTPDKQSTNQPYLRPSDLAVLPSSNSSAAVPTFSPPLSIQLVSRT
jgi:hypothetical protein